MIDGVFDITAGEPIDYHDEAEFEEIGAFPLADSPSHTVGYLIISHGSDFVGVAQCGAMIEGPTELVASDYAPFEVSGGSCDEVRDAMIAHFAQASARMGRPTKG